MNSSDQPVKNDIESGSDLGQQLSIHDDNQTAAPLIIAGAFVMVVVSGFTAYYLWEWKPISGQTSFFFIFGLAGLMGGIFMVLRASRRDIQAEAKDRRMGGMILALISLALVLMGFNSGLGSGLFALIMLVSGVSLLRYRRSFPGRFIALHENGMRSTLNTGEEMILWSDVALIKQFDYNTLLIRPDKSSFTLSGHPAVMRAVHQNVVLPMAEEIAGRIKAGDSVDFGPITADQQGLIVGKRRADWEKIDSLAMDITHVYINERGKRRGSWKVPVNDVENPQVLLNLSHKRKEGMAVEQQLQLTGPEVYPANSASLFRGVLLCIIGAGAIFYADTHNLINYSEGVEPFLWQSVGIPLILAALWRLYLLLGILRSEVLLTPQGVSLRRGKRLTEIAWTALDEMRYQHLMIRNGNLPIFAWYVLRLKAEDGKEIRLRRGYRHYEILHGRINAAFTEARLPALQERLEQGEDLRFGAVTLNQTGLTIDGEPLAWEALSGIRLRGLSLTLVKSDGVTVWKRLPLRKVTNYPLFLALSNDYVIYENPVISV